MSKPVRCDVLVIGSGVAGMAAAMKAASQGLNVIVAEKEQYFGGTTAISAGWAWVPGNKQGLEQGDTREEAETYLRSLAPDTFNEAGVSEFLDTVPEAICVLRERDRGEVHLSGEGPGLQDGPAGRENSPAGQSCRRMSTRGCWGTSGS